MQYEEMTREQLLAENIALRKQLAAYQEQVSTTYSSTDETEDDEYINHGLFESHLWITELKTQRLEKTKLQKRQIKVPSKLLRNIFDSSPAAISISTDTSCRVIRHNPAALEFFRVKEWESVSHSSFEIPPFKLLYQGQEIAPAMMPIQRSAWNGERVRDQEIEFVWEDGVRKFAVFSSNPLFSKSGEIIGAIASFQDITERKQMEETLQKSQQEARKQLSEIEVIYDSVPVGLCVLDSQLRFTRLNQRFAEINGLAIEDHIGRTPLEVVPYLGEQAEEAMRKIIKTGESLLNLEVNGETPSQPGVLRYWNENWLPIKDKQGKIIGVNISAVEITEQKQAETALRESEERYRLLAQKLQEVDLPTAEERFLKAFYSNPAAMIILRIKDSVILNVNDSALNMFGYRFEEVIGRTTKEIQFWRKQEDREKIRTELESNKEYEYLEIEFRKKNDETGIGLASYNIIQPQGESCLIVSIVDITARKQAEEKIQAERQYFYNLLDKLPVLLSLYAPEYRIAFANRRFREEMAVPNGRKCYQTLWGYDQPCSVCPPYKTLEDGKLREWEINFSGRDYHYYDYPFKDIDGSNIVLEIGIDITEQKKAERERIESEMRYRSLFENSLDGILLGSPDGSILDANPAACRMFGWTREELCTVGRKGTVDSNDPRLKLALEERDRLGHFHEELTLVRKDGTRFEGELTHKLFINAAGQELVSIIVRDISKRKQAEEALKQSEERFFKVFNRSSAMVWISCLEEGVFIDVNPAGLEMLGYSKEEIIGRSSIELGIWSNPGARQGLVQQIKSEVHVPFVELELHNKNGEILQVIASVDSIEINNQLYMIGNLIDVTKLKRLEKELDRLDRLNLVGEMAASIGHEIRNPMTTVRGFLQMLGQREKYAGDEKYFELMIEELDRANSIITEYLSVAKDKVVDLKTLGLNQVVNTIYPMIQANAVYTDKQVKLDLGLRSEILFDNKELRQLIMNLARNGLEAMPPGGVLTIRTREEDGEVILEVEDQGPGIPSEMVDKLGTPFVTTKDNGTGLGLAVCYSIALRHNARIEVDTSPSGTTFRVRFHSCKKTA